MRTKGRIIFVVAAILLVALALGGCAVSSLLSIKAAPINVNLGPNGTQQITVTATYDNGAHKDVTDGCSYKSMDDRTATVNKQGVVRGIAAGSVSIDIIYTEAGVSQTYTLPVKVR